ncbi:MAG: hypothetical protein KF773_33345 [Deltaproteobacteria bacterium]|nr:hypothetical protein [Deltaproteobacteria bacterium]
MYTLPAHQRIVLRRPSKSLVAMLAGAFDTPIHADRISVELTSRVDRASDPHENWRRQYAWLSFETGQSERIHDTIRSFELGPGDALLMCRLGVDVTVHLCSFSDEPDVHVAMDVARDAILEGRASAALEILRRALPHGFPLFVALVQKERTLLGQR